MIQIYSTLADKYFDSIEEATAAENEINNTEQITEQVKSINKKIADIKTQQKTEIEAIQCKINKIAQEITNLNKQKDALQLDIISIDEEAAYQINKLSDELAKLSLQTLDSDKNTTDCLNTVGSPECSVEVKTFDSSKDNDWRTIINKKGTIKEVEESLIDLCKDDSLKDLLKMFNI